MTIYVRRLCGYERSTRLRWAGIGAAALAVTGGGLALMRRMVPGAALFTVPFALPGVLADLLAPLALASFNTLSVCLLDAVQDVELFTSAGSLLMPLTLALKAAMVAGFVAWIVLLFWLGLTFGAMVPVTIVVVPIAIALLVWLVRRIPSAYDENRARGQLSGAVEERAARDRGSLGEAEQREIERMRGSSRWWSRIRKQRPFRWLPPITSSTMFRPDAPARCRVRTLRD